jgi:hypothetical protein
VLKAEGEGRRKNVEVLCSQTGDCTIYAEEKKIKGINFKYP